MWSEVISHMQPRYRFLAPDLPGYGRSALIPNFDTSLENMAQWVDELGAGVQAIPKSRTVAKQSAKIFFNMTDLLDRIIWQPGNL